MTELVQQRFKNDCFLCCIIMALGTTYESAALKWGPDFVDLVAEKGLYGQEMIRRAFGVFDLEMGRDYHSLLGPACGAPPEYVVKANPLKALLWGRRVIVQVKSKNYEGQSHSTYWDGHELHDPSKLKTYTWDEAEPEHIWIFNETKRAK